MPLRHDDFFNHNALRAQLNFQQKHAWSLEDGIDWGLAIDLNKYFLPLDDDAVAFPGATLEQKIALSQLLGLIVNATIAEMESVAHKIRDTAWRDILNSYPVNPEMYELGEQFFLEEAKHAQLFNRYNRKFCDDTGVSINDLQLIIPQAYGAIFQKAIYANAKAGGHAFWWVIAVVEEVSLIIYQQLHSHRQNLDPLFYQIHRRHFEEESKHTNYAFMMLELIKTRNKSLKQKVHLKIDRLYSDFFSTAWVLTELHKIWRVRDIASRHPFFATLASCLPLLEKLSSFELAQRLFISAPYISFILNRKHHKLSQQMAKNHKALGIMFPNPKPAKTSAYHPPSTTDQDFESLWKAN
jgi:hypothetical protein